MSAQPIHPHGPIPRDPKAIRAVLAGDLQEQFDAAYASALEQAKAPHYSLIELNYVLDQWWHFVNLADGHARIVEYGEKVLAGEPVEVSPITLDWLRS